MLIQEVEHQVGLSKKSIRFYEENGLLTPVRDAKNDYRQYSDEDIQKLKVIKFLRELGVSIRELRMLNNKEISLDEVLEEHIKKIDEEKKNYEQVKNMCLEIIQKHESYESLDINEKFEQISILNKGGFTLRNIKTNKRKKIMGAIISSLLFSLIFLLVVGVITYFEFFSGEPIPIFVYLFLIIIFLLPVMAVLYNLVIRIKEILGGEEDEASKY